MGRSARLAVPFVVTLTATLALCGAVAARVSPAAEAPPDFVREVLPIFSASCVRCHGPRKSEGAAAARQREGLREGRRLRRASSCPATATGSLLYQRLDRDRSRQAHAATEAAALEPGADRDDAALDRRRRGLAGGRDDPGGRGAAGGCCRRGPRPPGRDDPRHLLQHATCGPSWPTTATPATVPIADRPQGRTCGSTSRRSRRAARLGHGRHRPRSPRDKSALVARVLHADEERRMPLRHERHAAALRAAQIATLRRWIAEGAEWEPHWSYIPPDAAVASRRAATRDWPRNPIDAFVLAAIEKAGLAPVARGRPRGADPPPQLRPDRPAADAGGGRTRSSTTRAPDAYERQVDRLLASPHYGERMAVLLARPRALRRQRRLPQRQPAHVWPLPRLRDRRLQRATCRSTASPPSSSPATCCPTPTIEQQDRLRLQPAAPDDRGGRRPAQGVPGQVRGRPRAERLDGLARRDDRLRPVPRPQVRPVSRRATSTASPPSSPT